VTDEHCRLSRSLERFRKSLLFAKNERESRTPGLLDRERLGQRENATAMLPKTKKRTKPQNVSKHRILTTPTRTLDRLPDSNRRGGFFFLSCSAFNRFTASNRRLLCSSRSGVTCHAYTRCRRQRKNPSPRNHPPGPPQRHPRTGGGSAAKGKTFNPRALPAPESRATARSGRLASGTLLSGRWRDPQVHSALP
jgi:hypothetical protein